MTAYLDGVGRRARDLTVPMKRAGIYMFGSIQRNFQVGGRPRMWRPLKAATLAAKLRHGWSATPLVRTGQLRRSITPRADRRRMTIGTTVPYARIHQFGGRTGRRHATTIPARPYLVFQRDDLQVIRQMILDYIKGM